MSVTPSLDDLLAGTLERPVAAMGREERRDYYRDAMSEANLLAESRSGRASVDVRRPGELDELEYY